MGEVAPPTGTIGEWVDRLPIYKSYGFFLGRYKPLPITATAAVGSDLTGAYYYLAIAILLCGPIAYYVEPATALSSVAHYAALAPMIYCWARVIALFSLRRQMLKVAESPTSNTMSDERFDRFLAALQDNVRFTPPPAVEPRRRPPKREPYYDEESERRSQQRKEKEIHALQKELEHVLRWAGQYEAQGEGWRSVKLRADAAVIESKLRRLGA